MGSTTPLHALRYPVGGDAASGLAAYFANLADDVDNNLPVVSDTEPASPVTGLVWYCSDPAADTLLQIWDGSQWQPIVPNAAPQHLTNLVTPWTEAGGGAFAVVRGGMVCVYGALQNANYATSSFLTVATLPPGIPLPPVNVTAAVGGNTLAQRSVQITTAGQVQMCNSTGTGTASFYNLNVTYPVV